MLKLELALAAVPPSPVALGTGVSRHAPALQRVI